MLLNILNGSTSNQQRKGKIQGYHKGNSDGKIKDDKSFRFNQFPERYSIQDCSNIHKKVGFKKFTFII